MGRRNLVDIDKRIIQMAIKLGGKNGVDHISTIELAKKLEISEGTIFVHFQSKDNLIKACYDYIVDATNKFLEVAKKMPYTEKGCYELWEKMILNMTERPDTSKFFYSYYISRHRTSSPERKALFAGIINQMLSINNYPVDEETAYKIWNFTFTTTLRVAVMCIDNPSKIQSDEDMSRIFALIYSFILMKHDDPKYIK